MNPYFCPLCAISLNSQSQWEAHVLGIKHKKKAELKGLTCSQMEVLSSKSSNTTLASTLYNRSTSQLNTDAHLKTEQYCLGPNGAFMCSICPSVSANTVDQMKAHLDGQKHQKAFASKQLHSYSSLPAHSSTVKQPTTVPRSVSLDIKQSLRKAWNHQAQCQFDYHEVEGLSEDARCGFLSPHFALIPMNESIPNLLDFLKK